MTEEPKIPKKNVDPELLDKDQYEIPFYPKDLEKLLLRLGKSHQLQRRHMLRQKSLLELKKLLERDLRADPDGTSELAFMKKILIILITEILTLKGV